MENVITIEKLKEFSDKLNELDYLCRIKNKIEANKDDEAVIKKINIKIEKLNRIIIEDKKNIKTHINRLKKWNYRKILILRYIEKWKWREIIHEFFSYEDDFENEKFDKYKDTIMRWHRQAIMNLEKVSTKPFLSNSKQLVLKIEQ